ncbi:MAG: pantetheine-phosphate adenylyltransferase [Rhodospirillaceae bacterium]|nr:pantetheine-phosphate adenylyltransferase [Rhodospirillaceae bacterium]|tara:strand:- start:179 stop:685 length:507 start_codon:yes stop_codon:yes gene_type:complete
MRVGLYPGTFDPITNGHIDIIKRSTKLVDQLTIGIASNIDKNPFFNVKKRVEMVEYEILDIKKNINNNCEINVLPFSNLLIHFAKEINASMIFRGLRAVSDFDYEFQMVGMNTRLDQNIETVFLMSAENQQFISSRFVKEIAILGGDISTFVSSNVRENVINKINEIK